MSGLSRLGNIVLPMCRFEVVKDVVARGVSLKHAELWKKIRNKEPKPEDVTDRA